MKFKKISVLISSYLTHIHTHHPGVNALARDPDVQIDRYLINYIYVSTCKFIH